MEKKTKARDEYPQQRAVKGGSGHSPEENQSAYWIQQLFASSQQVVAMVPRSHFSLQHTQPKGLFLQRHPLSQRSRLDPCTSF